MKYVEALVERGGGMEYRFWGGHRKVEYLKCSIKERKRQVLGFAQRVVSLAWCLS